MDLTHKCMFNVKPATKWDEAYPSGNGSQGVLVMGNPLDETIIFNHEKLFLPLPINEASVLPDMSGELPAIRRLIKEGRYREATRHFLDRISEKGYPRELIWPDPFHPAYDLRIKTDDAGETADYLRWLDFETGEAGVRWHGSRGVYNRQVFVSRACNAVIIKLGAPSEGKLDCDICLEERPGKEHIKSVSVRAGRMADFTGQMPEQPYSGNDIWLVFDSRYEVGNGGYCGIARVHTAGGHIGLADGAARLHGADGAIIAVRTIPYEDHAAFSLAEAMAELAALPLDHDRLFNEHAKIHGRLFNRMRLDLCGRDNGTGESRRPDACMGAAVHDEIRALSNEELMDQASNGIITPVFIERMHDFGRYLLISSSGELPPNLQGVWNGIWTPPWSSDYTLDENLQMMMWQVLPGNMPELAQSYFNLIESFIDDWKTNARLFYGCRGIFSSPRSSTSGLHKHFCEDFPMMFWTAGAGWLAQMFYDHWQFTGDDAFLRDHTVPLLKEIALFYEDFLIEGPDGKYEFIPSYSPENTPANSDNPVAINATMDIAIAKEVLSNLISACQWLDIEKENIPKWSEMLGKLPDYMVNSDGALKEWSHPAFEDDYHHRHSSHLYPIFPGFEVTRSNTPELYQACLRAAELRLTDGIEAITGWGLAHLANISARLKDSELGFKALSRIMAKFLLPNLFTCHNEGELFQMDANLGFSAAILEMLVFSQSGYIELLPALPQGLSKGAAYGILCRGRITLTELQWDMDRKSVSVTVLSDTDQQIRLKLPCAIKSYEIDGERQEKEQLPGKGSSQESVAQLKDGSDSGASGCCDASQIRLKLKKDGETRLLFVLD